MRELNVFVSSTSVDLQDYRAVSRLVILDMNWKPRMMEHFGTRPGATPGEMRAILDECDLMLLILGFRRGWVPSVEQGGDGQSSITALELAHARARKIPILALLASETWPGNLWEDDAEARGWVRSFREEVNLPGVFFDYEEPTTREAERLPAFRAKVREALVGHRERLLAHRDAQPGESPHTKLDYFSAAREGLVSGKEVPFLGTGVYEDGPLSSFELTRALAGENAPDRLLSLATAAEYRERFLGSRPLFLESLREILEVQSAAAQQPSIYDLLVKLPGLPLIVSATYDEILENRLAAAGLPYVLITHILRSADGEHDGKILVIREDGQSEICLADKVDVQGAARVVYKPLGSPLLNDRVDADLEIDTVVVTETDHLTFLGRLENQLTQIPTAVTGIFRRRSLLFVGYGLDIWQYRLVMQVFQAVGSRGRSPMLAVRIPDTALEEVAWKRLGADLIRMPDPEFSRLMLAEAHAS